MKKIKISLAVAAALFFCACEDDSNIVASYAEVLESSSSVAEESSSSETAVVESSADVQSSSSEEETVSSSSEEAEKPAYDYEPISFECPTVSDKFKSEALLAMTLDVSGALRNDSTIFVVKISMTGLANSSACNAAVEKVNAYDGSNTEVVDQVYEYLNMEPNSVDSKFFEGASMDVDDGCPDNIEVTAVHMLDGDYDPDAAKEFLDVQQSRCENLSINKEAIKKQLCEDPSYAAIMAALGYCK